MKIDRNQLSSEKFIFYPLQTQFSNLGDLLINKILIKELQKKGKLIAHPGGASNTYIENLGLKEEDLSTNYSLKFNYLIVWVALRKLLAGKYGDVYLVPPPGHRYGHVNLQQSFTYWQTLIHYLIFRICGVKFCTFGVSIGPFSPILQNIEWCKSKLAYFYSVRDTFSEDYARQIGITNVNLFPDLGWLIDREAIARNGTQSLNDYIVFSFRDATNALTDKKVYQDALCQTLDAIVDKVCIQGSKKLVISYQVSQDLEFCKYLLERYQNRTEVILLEERVDENSMYRIYHNAFIVFSNRLHVLLFTISCGSLPIGVIDIEEHSKITSIFTDADLKNLLIDVRSENFDVNALNKLVEERELLLHKIYTYSQKTRDIGLNILDRVIGSPKTN